MSGTGSDDGAPHGANGATWLATVSTGFVEDWLRSLRAICPEATVERCLQRSGIVRALIDRPSGRLTHEQVVNLYRASAGATGDEMMGLWSRPIRPGSLKYIARSVADAPSIEVALYRFTQVWNLLLDDYELHLIKLRGFTSLELRARGPGAAVNRFGHALMLKLAHGIVSWLVHQEAPVVQVRFAFVRPPFADDYDTLFPVRVAFDAPASGITFHSELLKVPTRRDAQAVRRFLERAPRDWIFTAYQEHTIRLKVRDLLFADLGRTSDEIARRLNMSPRTLMRKLRDAGLGFQDIKDELRRDLAIVHLGRDDVPLTEIGYLLGFSSPPVFHRAFRRWTGMSPGAYRSAQARLPAGSGAARGQDPVVDGATAFMGFDGPW